MMTIGSVTGANNSIQGSQCGGMQMDAVSKGIQKQIANAQKQLQDLSSNDKMPLEEKMKKRQEIQQEISRLQQQLTQHQIEQRKQQSQRADIPVQQKQKPQAGKKEKGNGFSQPGMQSILSADSSVKQAEVQGSVASKMKNMANILKTEIKIDKGGNTEAKQAALAEMESKAAQASSSQISALADANQKMKETGKAEPGSKDVPGTEEKKEEGKGTDNNAENTGSVNGGVQDGTTPPPVAYKPVDISL